MSRRPFAPVTFLFLGLCACGPNTLTKIQPDLDLIGHALNFGDVALGDTSAPMALQASAVTEAQINLDISIQNDPDGVFSFKPAAPTAIPPRGQVSISVVFTPKAIKSYAATLVVKTNDPKPANALRQIALSGTGATASIAVLPTALSLSAMACPAGATGLSVGSCSATKPITIQNNGLVNLRLMSVSLVASGSGAVPANLTLQMPPAGETILVSGDMITVPVVWAPGPAEVGTFSAAVQIQSDDPMMPTVTVPITATSTAVQPPSVCLNVLSVEQRQYSSNSSGVPTYTQKPVTPVSLFLDPSDAQTVFASPGGQVALTSLVTNIRVADQAHPTMLDTTDTPAVDTAAQMSSPCTADPQGSPLVYAWSITPPTSSGAMVMPGPDPFFSGSPASDGVVTLDVAGGYTVTLTVTNGFGLSATATYQIIAQPHDDLLVQVQWTSPTPMGDIVDLDLHLIVDSGPGVAASGTFLSNQDCFWNNLAPTWFSGQYADFVPNPLRLDQGESGGFDDTDLQTAPLGSSYRAVVHYYSGMTPTTPLLSVYYQGTLVSPPAQPLSPSTPMSLNELWVGARITFPAQCPVSCAGGTAAGCCPPTVTLLDDHCTFEPGDVPGQFTGNVTGCTGGTTL